MGEQQRWTAKRKAEIILQILRQTTTVVDVARQNDLAPSEVQDWIDTFLKAGEKGLKARASDLQEQTEKEIKELKAAIGDLYVENAILKKAKALWGTYSVPLFVQTIYNERGEERWENSNDGQRSEKQRSFCRSFARQPRLSM
jgi:transposase-like protein